jgi:hypothetical protein
MEVKTKRQIYAVQDMSNTWGLKIGVALEAHKYCTE